MAALVIRGSFTTSLVGPTLGQGGQGMCLWPQIYVGPKKKNIVLSPQKKIISWMKYINSIRGLAAPMIENVRL